jgi:hypothetical protein
MKQMPTVAFSLRDVPYGRDKYRAAVVKKSLFGLTACLVLLLGVPTVAYADSGAASPVSIRLVLRHTSIVAGRVLKGDAIISNHSSKTILVATCAIDGWLDVGLSNQSYTYSPISPLVACAPTIHLRPGVNHFPIKVSTNYQVCTKSRPTATLPKCAKSGMPTLPRGQYHTSVIMLGFPKNTPAPSKVKVTIR